jgi:hypothetical protein
MEALKLLTVDDLIVYALDDGTYRLCYSVAYRPPETPAGVGGRAAFLP